MAADIFAKHTPNAPEFICPICLPKPKSSGMHWKKASLRVRSPWHSNIIREFGCDILGKWNSWKGSHTRKKWKNCRLTTKIQTTNLIGPFWPSEGSYIDTINTIFILHGKNSPNLACYITFRVHNINHQSTVLNFVLPWLHMSENIKIYKIESHSWIIYQ